MLLSHAMITEWYREQIIRRKASTSENRAEEEEVVGGNWAIGRGQTGRVLTRA
jgi:hypothetical protein